MEKTTAEAQLQQLQLQEKQLKAQNAILHEQLGWSVHTDERVAPVYSDLRLRIESNDSALINNHPLLEYENKKVALSMVQVAVEKTKLTPDFTIGYNNQSIKGFQSKDGVSQQYYGGSDRFHTAMLSVGIPLFNKATKAKIRAGKAGHEVAMLEADAAKHYLISRSSRNRPTHCWPASG